MSSCPICGAALPEERPRHNVVLECRGRTRSTAQSADDSAGSETADHDGALQRQLCVECWGDLHERIVGRRPGDPP